MECEFEFCKRSGKVRLEKRLLCVRCYNRVRRAKMRVEKGVEDNSARDAELQLQALQEEMAHTITSLMEASEALDNCINVTCAVHWKNEIVRLTRSIRDIKGLIRDIRRGDTLGAEKEFQKNVRKELKAIEHSTKKYSGSVALPGVPDISSLAEWGGFMYIEFKAGRPKTEQAALDKLTGAQRMFLIEWAVRKGPAIMCVGEGMHGTIVEIDGLIDKSRCGVLHYVHVSELAVQIEGWARAWTEAAVKRWKALRTSREIKEVENGG